MKRNPRIRRTPTFEVIFGCKKCVFKSRMPPERQLAKVAYLSHPTVIIVIIMGINTI